MKKLKIISLFLLLIILSGCANSSSQLILKGQTIDVEIASDYISRAEGLAGRDYLCANCGMVFIMARKDIHPFWMGAMNFPIDIIYIDGDEIVEIFKNVPIIDIKTQQFTEIKPNNMADKILELSAGWCAQNQVSIGDKIELTK